MNAPTLTPAAPRLASLDAYRGVVLFLMMAEALRLCAVAAAVPDSAFWRLLCHHQSHVEWVGCSLHDLIQPSFSFLVGVVLPFSLANRRARGQTLGALTRHAALRSIILILLGVAILSVHPKRILWKFEDTLSQIGLGYLFLFLIALRPRRDWWIALGLILTGDWLAFALFPLPGPDFDYAAVGVSAEWLREHGLTGFAAHWQKNSNIAAAFDLWFLNLFPQDTPYLAAPKGLTTLNFVPLLATMILGLIAGDVLRSSRQPWEKVRWLAVAGVLGIAAGWTLGTLGVCPVVKSLWTPSWVLFSGGWCFLLLSASHVLVDLLGRKKPAFVFIVLGMNSIAAYCLSHVFEAFAFNSLKRIFGSAPFLIFGAAYEPLLYGAAVLVMLWLVVFAMHWKKIHVRI